MKIQLCTCPSCGIVVDWDKCAELYGYNDEYCHEPIHTTKCPVCGKEIPDQDDTHWLPIEFKKKQKEE
mgnify:FL=1